jgi:hypothetical protein
MKAFLVLLCFFPAVCSYGQAGTGSVTFANTFFPTNLFPIVWNGTNVNATVALYGSTELNLTSDSSLAPIGTAQTFVPGFFSAGAAYIAMPGQTVTLQVRAWTGGFATWDAAYAAALVNPEIALSHDDRYMWEQPVGGGTLPSQPITFSDGRRFRGLTLSTIPEPSSIALGILGLIVCAVFLRKPNGR